jgi:hypothetical protein
MGRGRRDRSSRGGGPPARRRRRRRAADSRCLPSASTSPKTRTRCSCSYSRRSGPAVYRGRFKHERRGPNPGSILIERKVDKGAILRDLEELGLVARSAPEPTA